MFFWLERGIKCIAVGTKWRATSSCGFVTESRARFYRNQVGLAELDSWTAYRAGLFYGRGRRRNEGVSHQEIVSRTVFIFAADTSVRYSQVLTWKSFALKNLVAREFPPEEIKIDNKTRIERTNWISDKPTNVISWDVISLSNPKRITIRDNIFSFKKGEGWTQLC